MLIICSECGKEYSDQAKRCPHYGAITSKNRYISNNIEGNYRENRIIANEEIGIVKIIIIIVTIAIAVFFIIAKTQPTNTTGKSTSTSNDNYLLNNKPTAKQIASAKTINYVGLYKGANTLKGNFYKITGEIVQVVEDHLYHINMTRLLYLL